jgi:hypothetical protein
VPAHYHCIHDYIVHFGLPSALLEDPDSPDWVGRLDNHSVNGKLVIFGSLTAGVDTYLQCASIATAVCQVLRKLEATGNLELTES